MNEELKTCPFFGAKPFKHYRHSSITHNDNCFLLGGYIPYMKLITNIKEWNTRQPDPHIKEALEEMLVLESGIVLSKIANNGSYTTSDLKDLSPEWDSNYETGLNQGMSFSGEVILSGSPSQITLIPVLIGDTDKGKKTYVCDEKQYGYQIIL